MESWLESTDYTASRKRELLALWANRDTWKLTPKLFKQVKSFIKDETYPEYKYPRLINSRVDLAKCFIGPVVDAISNQVFSSPWFIKKIPVVERPKAINDTLYRPNSIYTFTDYTAFEAHFVPEIMRVCQFRLYEYMTKNLDCASDVMKFCFGTLGGRNRCEFKHVTVGINGVRMSGEMDTSLANGFHNLMAFLYATWQNDHDAKVYGFVEGDDGIFRVEPHSATPTEKQFADLGLTIKIGQTPHLSEASFCGQVYDVEESIVITDVVEVLARFGWTNKKYVQASDKTRMELLRAKGYSLTYQYNGCPVLSVLGRRILELTKEFTISDKILMNMDQWERSKLCQFLKTPLPEEKETGVGTRSLVEKLYGLPTHIQIQWEERIRNCELGPIDLDLTSYVKEPSWIEYYERYSHPVFDTNPCWLLCDEAPFLEYLASRAPQTKEFISSL